MSLSRFVLAAILGLPLAAGAEEMRIWRSYYQAAIGGGTRCAAGAVDVWETPRTFSLHLQNSQWEIWSVDLADDGSADKTFLAQGVGPGNRPEIRVTIPAGRGPRTFRIFNRYQNCDYTLPAGDYIK